MSNTGPVSYWWVGGSTGSTAASRFDWNVAGNWRVLKNQKYSLSSWNITTPDYPPMGGDYVNIGWGSKYSQELGSAGTIYSPLLFGGFSGSGSTGCWICSGTGSGLSGASGTTFMTGLGGLYINEDYVENFTNSTYKLGSVFGGGLTGTWGYIDQVDLLSFLNVTGMNSTLWYALSSSATTRQSSLNIKTKYFGIENAPKVSNNQFYCKPQFIDNYDTTLTSTGNISTDFMISQTFNRPIVLKITDSKIVNIWSYGGSGGLIELNNCNVYSIKDNGKVTTFLTDDNCIIGNLIATVYGNISNYHLSGTWRNSSASSILGFSGTTAPNIDITGWRSADLPLYVGLGGESMAFKFTGGGTFITDTVLIKGNQEYPDFINAPQVVINQPATITDTLLLDHGAQLTTTIDDNTRAITVKTIELKNKAVVDFSFNSGKFNNWRIGTAIASASGLTLQGGIVFSTPDTRIIGDPGIRFINYGIYKGSNYDWRNNRGTGESQYIWNEVR